MLTWTENRQGEHFLDQDGLILGFVWKNSDGGIFWYPENQEPITQETLQEITNKMELLNEN